MSEVEVQLLAAIRERPEDDAPRLVYADWLSERGDPRGELISVQCAMARLARDDDHRPALEARDRELRAHFEATWRGDLLSLPGFASGYLERGFVRRLAMNESALGTHLSRALAAAPLLEAVHLSRYPANGDQTGDDPAVAPPELAALRGITYATTRYALAGLASGHLDGIEGLELGRGIDAVAAIDAALARPLRLRMLDVCLAGVPSRRLERLLAWPGIATVERLHAMGSKLDDAAIARFAASPSLGALRVAWLWDNPMRDGGVEALVTSAHLASLAELHLDRTTGGAAIGLSTLPALVKLHYGGNDLRRGAAQRLASARGLAGLQHLSLRGDNRRDAPTLDVDGACAVISSPTLASLHTLDLEQNPLGDAAMAEVIAAARPGLRSLKLSYGDLDVAAARAVANNPNLASLVELDLSDNPLGSAAIEELAASPHLRPRKLVLSSTHPGEGLRALARSPVLSQLRILELASCRLDPEALEVLGASPRLGNLTRLHVGYNRGVGDEGAVRLAAGRLPRLAELDVRSCEVREAGRDALVRAGHHTLA